MNEYEWQKVFDMLFEPYKVLSFDTRGVRAMTFLDHPDRYGDFDAIVVWLSWPQDHPDNYKLLSQVVQKAFGRPVYVMPADHIPETERLAIEHGARGIFSLSVDDIEKAIDEVKRSMDECRSLPRN